MTDRGVVSVVIPTYYRNDTLQKAIESVREQTYDRTEVIVVDGSDDRRAASVAEQYDAEYIHQGEDGGAHVARSLGAETATGAYINFLDDDDRMKPDKLEKQLPLHDAESVGAVYCGIQWETGHDVLPDPDVQGDVLDYALMFHMTPSSPSTMLLDGDVVRDILPLQNRHGADDMGMKIELAKRCEFTFVDEPLVLKGDSDDTLGGSRENIRGRKELLRRYEQLYEQYPPGVRRTALAHTHLLDAELDLNESLWSAAAIRKAALACYHIPGYPVPFVGYLCATLFGQIGRDVARRIYIEFLLDSGHRGKLTTPGDVN